jgi:hypothetical protein
MSSMAKYTRLVLLGKNLLWVLAAGIIALVVWIASNNNADNGGRMVFTNVPKAADMQNIMQKPRYHGVDVHNRPYTIDADSALQKDKDTVVLQNVSADMTGDNNAWIALKSGSGELNMTTKEMELLQGVEVFYEGGYQFRTDHAHVDIGKGSVFGDSHIEGQGAAGTIKANSFTITERGNIINFNGSVRMLLYQEKTALAPKPSAPKKNAIVKKIATTKKPVVSKKIEKNSKTKKTKKKQ